MTDEEKASIRDLLKTADINLSERQTNILCRAFELSLTETYEQGFVKGKKEGYEQGYEDCRHYAHDYYKPKWHDLRKDPNDLPDNGRRVLVKDKSRREYDVACLCRSKGSSDFWSNEHFALCISDNYVIAWCELPKFEE